MTDKCKSEITTLEKIGGKVRTAIIEHNDAIQQYNAALSRIRSAIEVINYWGLYNDELY